MSTSNRRTCSSSDPANTLVLGRPAPCGFTLTDEGFDCCDLPLSEEEEEAIITDFPSDLVSNPSSEPELIFSTDTESDCSLTLPTETSPEPSSSPAPRSPLDRALDAEASARSRYLAAEANLERLHREMMEKYRIFENPDMRKTDARNTFPVNLRRKERVKEGIKSAARAVRECEMELVMKISEREMVEREMRHDEEIEQMTEGLRRFRFVDEEEEQVGGAR